jgi:hypothetical protein
LARGGDVAIAIGLTHDISSDVSHYLTGSGLPVGRVIYGIPEGNPGPTSVQSGDHAWALAEKVVEKLRKRTIDERLGMVHLFVAAPNGFVFFLGQLSHSFGRIVVYEFDFDSNEPGAYQPAMSFPTAP